MGTSWKPIKNADGKGGVRYREHPSRKHGAVPDRYYTLTYWWQGKTTTEKVGWASEGWTPSKCFDLLSTLKRNQSTGEGPRTMREMRDENEAKRIAEEKARKREEEAERKRSVSFKTFFDDDFYPDASANWKPETGRKPKEHVKRWIHPVTGDVPMRQLNLTHVKRIRASMVRARRSARSQQYVFRTFTTVWNAARDLGIVDRPCPTKSNSFRLPRIDNERERFLSIEEADKLLAAVRARSQQVHDMALLSLHSGMRFSEIARLTWGCVNTESETIRVYGKGEKSRTIEMGNPVVKLFDGMKRGERKDLVFPNSEGREQLQVPSSFKRAIDDVGLNDSVADPKHRFGFHGLRHTRASWLRKSGSDLYTIQRILGHSTPVVTQRYAHIEQEELRTATDAVDAMLRSAKTEASGSVSGGDARQGE